MKLNIKNIKSDDIVGGVSGKFFLKRLPWIAGGIFLALCYISVRFDCITAMETVQHLKHQLEVTRTETQRERAMYMSATSESSMQHMVDSLHLGLHIQERPPYTLTIKK